MTHPHGFVSITILKVFLDALFLDERLLFDQIGPMLNLHTLLHRHIIGRASLRHVERLKAPWYSATVILAPYRAQRACYASDRCSCLESIKTSHINYVGGYIWRFLLHGAIKRTKVNSNRKRV